MEMETCARPGNWPACLTGNEGWVPHSSLLLAWVGYHGTRRALFQSPHHATSFTQFRL